MTQTFKNWICIGRADEIVADGSFIAKNICDEPIVVVNIGDGKLAAYYNVCRHHAAQICDQGTGQLDPVKKVRKKYLEASEQLQNLPPMLVGRTIQQFNCCIIMTRLSAFKYQVMKCPYHGWEYSAIDGRLSKALQVQGL